MTRWLGTGNGLAAWDDPEVLEEAALAMAQATLQLAMETSNTRRSELAKKMRRPRSFVTRMMGGGNLTIRTFARALAACGFEARFSYEPIWAGHDEGVGQEPALNLRAPEVDVATGPELTEADIPMAA